MSVVWRCRLVLDDRRFMLCAAGTEPDEKGHAFLVLPSSSLPSRFPLLRRSLLITLASCSMRCPDITGDRVPDRQHEGTDSVTKEGGVVPCSLQMRPIAKLAGGKCSHALLSPRVQHGMYHLSRTEVAINASWTL